MNGLENAIMLAQRGYAVHWVRPRSKAPIASGWPTVPVATLRELRQTYQPGYNVGVRCGRWSKPLPAHGLVVLDVDIRRADAYSAAISALAALIEATAHGPTVLSGSGMGGRHLWYACPLERLPARANITLAQADERLPDTQQWVWQIEVLSTGKQVVVPPSIHPDGQPYRWLTPLSTTQLLPAAVHTAIADALSAALRLAEATGRVVHGGPAGTDTRPGDHFNLRADWTSILEPHGWVPLQQHGDVTYWRRPGKQEGSSATTNYNGSGLLYVFSSNAAPFEADTAYRPFEAYALLEHGGDCAQAAHALQAQGYGSAEVPPWR
jgi:hypothetical protein